MSSPIRITCFSARQQQQVIHQPNQAVAFLGHIAQNIGLLLAGDGRLTAQQAKIAALEAILLGLSAYGVWRQKRAWLNLAMILSILLLLGALPGIFFTGRFFNFWNFARAIFQAGAAAVILALGVLPSARDCFA